MIGAGFPASASAPRVGVPEVSNPFDSCRPACWETTGSCAEELGAEPCLGEGKGTEQVERKIRSELRCLERLPVLAAFRCFETLAGACRSGPPPTPFASTSPQWRKCCVNVWVFQTPETHKHKQDRRQAPTRIGVTVSQPPPQVRARMYGCFKSFKRTSASDAGAATGVYVFTVLSPGDPGPSDSKAHYSCTFRGRGALLLRIALLRSRT